jgi:hypothetical protein
VDFAVTEKADRYYVFKIIEPLAVSALFVMDFGSDAAADRAV